jgi:hypothetical protein
LWDPLKRVLLFVGFKFRRFLPVILFLFLRNLLAWPTRSMSINEGTPLIREGASDVGIALTKSSTVGLPPPALHTPQVRKHSLRNGFDQIRRVGVPKAVLSEVFFLLLDLPWWLLAVVIALAYGLLSVVFGSLVFAAASQFDPLVPGYAGALFLSVSVMTAQGAAPYVATGAGARILLALNGFTSVLCAALLTGLVFARFSAPSARAMWSDCVTVCKFNAQNSLIVRVANMRSNFCIRASAALSLAVTERTREGAVAAPRLLVLLMRCATQASPSGASTT